MISPSASPADCPYLAITAPSVIRPRLGVPPGVHNEPVPGFVPGTPHHDVGVRLPLEKGPGQRLWTEDRPVSHGLSRRCLLDARALSRPNPPVRPASPVPA